jgi:hypothetical protein
VAFHLVCNVWIFYALITSKVLVQIMDKRKKGIDSFWNPTPKQLIQITDEYIYSDFGQIVPLI